MNEDTVDISIDLDNFFIDGPPRPTTKMLFDDEARFVDLLVDGKGVAKLHEESPFSGNACLSVTPPQRYSARIPGWSFRIAKNPKPGEFRYLRLAWKSPRAKGVMIELAASGRWPDSKSPKRRYFSGANTTKWQALRVSDDSPRGWTSVTIDLWKDCGAFTLTGIAPTAMGGEALFDRIELLANLDGG